MKKFVNATNGWDPTKGDYQIDYESTNTYQKKKRRKKIALTILAVLIVAAFLIGGYFWAEGYLFNIGQV